MINTTFHAINSLGDIPFIGGTSFTLIFGCKDQYGNDIDLTGATVRWKAAPYGTTYAVVDKTASITSTNTFKVYLTPLDTAKLEGKYNHQPQITFPDGNVVIPTQGIVTVVGGL